LRVPSATTGLMTVQMARAPSAVLTFVATRSIVPASSTRWKTVVAAPSRSAMPSTTGERAWRRAEDAGRNPAELIRDAWSDPW
jgi:hypothetical protein